MKLETLTDTPELGDLVCEACLQPAPIVSVVTVGPGTSVRFRICDGCLEELRGLIRKQRARRPLSPRCRRALEFFVNVGKATGREPLEVLVVYSELAGVIGKYATNVIKTLLERKLIDLEPPRAGGPFKAARFRITAAGVAAVDTLELAPATK